MQKTLKRLAWAAFLLYLLILAYILFFRGRGNVSMQQMPLSEYMTYAVNLVPFETIRGFWNAYRNDRIQTDIMMLNIFGNIALFIPFGFFLPAARRLRALWKCLAVSLFAILAAESAQLLFKVGSFDIDDVILNLLGVLIGYAAFKAVFPIYKNLLKKTNY